MVLVPGLQFYAEPISCYCGGVPADAPRLNELYVICQDGSVQSVYEPERIIHWTIYEEGNTFYYAHRKPCLVRYHSKTVPPLGRATPQNAEITEQPDKGPEVTSQLRDIAKIDPLLAQCAVIVDDPVQTAAMAKFARGEMSYAEMRGLCG